MTANDLALLKRWQTRRDPEAFQELVHRHANMVFATCRRVLGNAADAEEVAQDCFLSLADSPDKPSRSLGGWLHVLATSRARDRIRGDVRRREREERFAAEQSSGAELSEAAAVLDDALGALPDRLREPLVVHFLEGLTHAETAKRLGVSRPTVTRRINKGLERLRHEMRGRNVVITAAALTKLLTAESASAAPASLVAALGVVALNAGPFTVAAAGGGLFTWAIGAIVVVGVCAGLITLAAPQARPIAQSSTPQDVVTTEQAPIPTSVSTPDVMAATDAQATGGGTQASVVSEVRSAPQSGARIFGVVRDLAGNPVADIEVRVRADRDAFTTMGQATTSDDGRFSIDGVSPTEKLLAFASDPSRDFSSPYVDVGAVLAGQEYEVDLVVDQASIAGIVVDKDGRVIAHAEVSARPTTNSALFGTLTVSLADEKGAFNLPGLHAGDYELQVRVGGDRQPWTDAGRITLTEAEHRTGLRLKFGIDGEHWIWGAAANADGQPVTGAQVNVYSLATHESTDVTSGESGEFLLGVEGDGPFNVQVRHRDYGTTLVRDVMPDMGPTEVVLEARGGLQARVIDQATGEPIEEFEVLVFAPVQDSPSTLYTAEWRPVVDPDGQFSLDGLEPGMQHMRIRAANYSGSEHAVQIRSGLVTDNTVFPLERARRIVGVVVDIKGNPVAGARVFAGPLPSDFRNGASTEDAMDLSDGSGRFQLLEAPSSTILVSAAHPEYAPVSQAIDETASDVRVVLYAGNTIAGSVALDGQPVSGVSVMVLHNPDTQPVLIASAKTSDAGLFEASKIGPGKIMLYVELELERQYGRRFISRTLEMDPGAMPPVHFNFETGDAVMEGTVTNAGQPVRSAMVMLKSGTPLVNAELVRTRSDEFGRYRIEGLKPGVYEVETLIPGIEDSEKLDIVSVVLNAGESLLVDVSI